MNATTDTTHLTERIRKTINTEILPLLNMDGNGVEIVGLDEGILQVRLLGTCTGCPSSVRAMIFGIEEELQHRFPEVRYLEAVP